MKILTFCPVSRIEPETVASIFTQNVGMDVMFTFDNPISPEDGIFRNIQYNYEKMRKTVLTMGYDKVWIVESDTIPPPDALQKMLLVDADVVTGVYAHRHGPYGPNVWRKEATAGNNALNWDDVRNNWGLVVDVNGGCMGCLLVDRKVLEGFSFIRKHKMPPDMDFMGYCVDNGITQKADLSVLCGHKKLNGEILKVDKERGYIIERN